MFPGKMELLALIVSGLWAFFKFSTWRYMKQTAALEKLYEAIEVGVAEAWTRVVKPYLEKNGKDAKLPQEIRDQAESVAVTEAEKINPGVKKFSREMIITTIKKAVEERKRLGGK
jgi:hypothetical protein